MGKPHHEVRALTAKMFDAQGASMRLYDLPEDKQPPSTVEQRVSRLVAVDVDKAASCWPAGIPKPWSITLGLILDVVADAREGAFRS